MTYKDRIKAEFGKVLRRVQRVTSDSPYGLGTGFRAQPPSPHASDHRRSRSGVSTEPLLKRERLIRELIDLQRQIVHVRATRCEHVIVGVRGVRPITVQAEREGIEDD